MKYTQNELLLLWLNGLEYFDYSHKKFLFDLLKNSSSISLEITNHQSEIISVIGEEKFNTLTKSATSENLKFQLNQLSKFSVVAVTIESAAYPERLKGLDEPPLCLYAKGDITLLKEKNILAIVGSRKILSASIKACEELVKPITESGITVVTGIAEGGDITAINTVLGIGGKVISVLAGGLDYIYPVAHTDKVEEIIKKGGLVLTEQFVGVKPQPFTFPVRNRIIAGIADKTLVVSAGEKSGTLYTAEYAFKLKREVFAIPYSVGVQSGVGCNALIKKGAKLVDKPSDILNAFGVKEEKKAPISLTAEEKAVVDAIKGGNTHIEKIAQVTGKKAFMLFPIISMLEIKGIIVKNGVNVYGLTLNGLEE